jgi:hypothetical protein
MEGLDQFNSTAASGTSKMYAASTGQVGPNAPDFVRAVWKKKKKYLSLL